MHALSWRLPGADYNGPQFLRIIMSIGAAQAKESVGGTTAKGPDGEEPTLVGATLEGAYRITRLIAEGGMSAVYEAVQLRLNQRVAVKVMARALASNPEALARFRREAEITSRLRHPHLVSVMDFGTGPAGQPYLVMEYLEGIDLEQRIRKLGKLPLPAVVHITRQVASALASAHEQGVVHRDLKPANVFLVDVPGEPDFVKVLDFGISKVRAANTQLTKAQSIIGTPNYMSPEQATGMLDEIDHRTDQWALACIVWEMLSGRGPFASDDMSAVFYQVIHLDPRPLGQRAPGLPAAVETVLRRALAKTMTDRFPSIRDFANALERAACGQPTEATPAASRTAAVSPGRGTTPDGTMWVERRREGRERRRAPPVAGTAPAPGQAGDDARTGPVGATPVPKRSRIYAVAALTAGVLLVALVPGRGDPAAGPSRAPSSVVASLPVPVPVPSAPAAPAIAAGVEKPKQSSLDEAARKPAVRASRPARPAKPSPARAARHVDDSIDPFAPVGPPRRPQPAKADTAVVDFADPFAP